jgi:hypothetical protein
VVHLIDLDRKVWLDFAAIFRWKTEVMVVPGGSIPRIFLRKSAPKRVGISGQDE